MKKLIFICAILLILTMGAVSASHNATSDDVDLPIAQTIEKETIINSNDLQEEVIQMQENTSPIESGEKINASYVISVDKEYLRGSGFEGQFNIEMYERELLNGNLKIYIDDELKFNKNPGVDYYDAPDTPYSLLDTNFLDELDLTYGPHKAEFKYSKDSLFNDFDEIRYFNYTYIKFYVPEDENEYESTCVLGAESLDATGKLKILLDNKTIHDDDFWGYAYLDIDFENLTYGNHTYDIYYTGNDYFKSIHKQGTFKKTYEFDAYIGDDDEIPLDENELRVYLPVDAKSNVVVVVNNKTYLAAPKRGIGSLNIAYVKLTNLKLGENSIQITYGDDKHYEKTIIKNVTMIPALHFPYFESCEYQYDASATLIMPENANGTLKIKIDDAYFTSELVNGTASIPLDMITVGTHNFEITYTGDYEEYFKNETYENISITEAHDLKDWDIEFSFYVENNNDDCYLYVTLFKPTDLKGTQTYYIDGEKCGEYYDYIDDSYNNYEHWMKACKDLGNKYLELSNGTHVLTVSHSGNDYYIAKNKTVTFAKPLNKKTVSGVIIDIDEDLIIELPEGENGTATITINNNPKTITIENATYKYPLELSEGIWDINVTYKGNSINKTKTFKLDTISEHFTLLCDDYYYKNSVKVAYVDFFEDEKTFLKHATILIDNKKYNGPLDYGEIDLSKLSAGTHTIVVNYKNDKNTIIQSAKKKFTIVSYSYPKIELKDIHSQELNDGFKISDRILLLSNGTTLIMDIDLNGNIKGKVTTYKTLAEIYGRYDEVYDTIIGEYGKFNLNKGKARISIPTETFNNTYDLKLVISLEDGNTINASFKIRWCPKVAHPTKMTYTEKQTLTLYVPEVNNRTIGMFGNFKTVYSQIINGKAEFPLSSLPIGNGIKATFIFSSLDYDEDVGYYSSNYNIYNLKLNIQDSSQKINMYYNDGTTYSLKVSKIYGKEVGKGKTVTFKIGKTTIKVKTDKNGVAKLKIPDKIKPGTYTLTATYKYGKITKKLTVKQVLSIKTVKVKKSAKKVILTATLKKGKNPIKNKQITFKFNGKTYKAKTNSKGIAKITIKSNVLKKLKSGKKITYQATYLKDTAKKTVKVQR